VLQHSDGQRCGRRLPQRRGDLELLLFGTSGYNQRPVSFLPEEAAVGTHRHVGAIGDLIGSGHDDIVAFMMTATTSGDAMRYRDG
jgi:hypothetical protein